MVASREVGFVAGGNFAKFLTVTSVFRLGRSGGLILASRLEPDRIEIILF